MALLEKLETSLRLVDALKAENDVYKENFDELRQSHEQLSSYCDNLQHLYNVASSEYTAAEKQVEELNEYWKAVVDKKNEEVEALRSKTLDSREMEKLRLQIAREVEQKQKRGLLLLDEVLSGIVPNWAYNCANKEAAKYKGSYFALRREYELFRSETCRQAEKHQQIIKEIHTAHDDEVNILKRRISDMEMAADSTSELERLRSLQRDNAELQLKVQTLTIELDEVRAKKESVALDSDQRERLLQRKILEESAMAKSVSVEKETLQSKLNTMMEESKTLIRRNDELSDENLKLSKELLRCRNQMEEVAHRTNLEHSQLKMSSLQQQRKMEAVVTEQRKKIAELEGTITGSNETIAELRNMIAKAERAKTDGVREARDGELDRINHLNAEKTELENRLTETINAISELKIKSDTLARETSQEISRLRKELRDSLSLNELLTAQSERMLSEKESLVNQLSTEKTRSHALDALIVKQAKEVDEYRATEQNLRDKNARLEIMMKGAEVDAAKAIERLERENEAIAHNYDKCAAGWGVERDHLKADVARLTEEVETVRDEEQRIKKECEETYVRYASVKRKFLAAKKVNGALKADLEAMVDRERERRMAEERRSKDFLSFIAEEANRQVL
ncbi:Centrosomal protein of 83 kDa [Irineochytrium annulatum]|nr:Centrosomal protein of 83 kDa [Irineochytrium annulatum]